MAELWLAERNAEQLQQLLPVILTFTLQAFEVFSWWLRVLKLNPCMSCLVEPSQIVKFKVWLLKHAFEMCVL